MDTKINKLINEFYEKVSYVLNYQGKERSNGISAFGLVIYNNEEIISEIYKHENNIYISCSSIGDLFIINFRNNVISSYESGVEDIELNEINLIKFFGKFNIYENQGTIV